MYVTYDDVVIRYPVVKTWGSNETEVNSGLIPFAEADLNSRLAPAFTVPFSDTPLIIKDLTLDLLYLKMLATRASGKEQMATFKELKTCFNDRIDRLVNGEDALTTDSGTIIDPSGSANDVWYSNEDYHPTHSMLDAEDQATMISSDRLYDELWERGG